MSAWVKPSNAVVARWAIFLRDCSIGRETIQENKAALWSSRAQAHTALGREFPTFALSMAKRVPRPAMKAELICSIYSALCSYFDCREDSYLPSVFSFIVGNYPSDLQNLVHSCSGPLHFSTFPRISW
jgi:hypothetical protein